MDMNKNIMRIYRNILSGLLEGRILPGEVLPTEHELADQFGTTRMNAHRALKELEKNHLVTSKKRAGTRINKHLNLDKIQEMLQASNRSIFVIYSMTPRWIHWNETTFREFEKTVSGSGFSVTYRTIPADSGREQYSRLLKDIFASGASALVILPDMDDTEFLKANGDLLLDFPMPVFMLNRSGEPLPLDLVSFVAMNPFGDGVAVGSLLKRNGCKQILMITPDRELFWCQKRIEGIKLGLGLDRGGNRIEFVQIPTPELGNNASEAIAKLREMGSESVVIAPNNLYAANFIETAKESGLRVIGDYKLIAFDDNPLYQSYDLTSLGIPMEEVGQVFGRLICDRSWADYRGKVSIRLSSKLVVRKTYNPKII